MLALLLSASPLASAFGRKHLAWVGMHGLREGSSGIDLLRMNKKIGEEEVELPEKFGLG